MIITKISLTNIRCFEQFEVNLQNKGGAKNWMVILGDNGVGKTTILRSIAIGLCEESGASGLLSEIYGDWIRSGADKGIIRIELKPREDYRKKAYIETTLTRKRYGEVDLKQEVFPKNPKSFSWEELFVCAYGAARGVYGTADLSEYAVTDSVYSLFNYKAELQNPELSLRRIQAEIGEIGEILKKLESILMVREGAIKLTKTGITIEGIWGEAMPSGALGDGYRSTLTWLLDLYGWRLLYEENMQEFEISGIVIIDEFEQHLHPKWQKQIVELLSKEFPNVQFITSTHSPLCVIGTTALDDEDCSITVLQQGSDSVKFEITTPPRGKRADQVLTSYLFELYTTSDDQLKEKIEKYNFLYNKKKSEEEEIQLNVLRDYLNAKLGSPETELEKLIEDAVATSLISMTDKALSNFNENHPHYYEIRRQLKDLFT